MPTTTIARDPHGQHRTTTRSLLIVVALVTALSLLLVTHAHAAVGTSVTGRLVTPDGAPAGRVLVVVRDFETSPPTIAGVTVSRPNGTFRVSSELSEEIDLLFISFGGFESGFLSCTREVVPTQSEACTTAPGALGDVVIERR